MRYNNINFLDRKFLEWMIIYYDNQLKKINYDEEHPYYKKWMDEANSLIKCYEKKIIVTLQK